MTVLTLEPAFDVLGVEPVKVTAVPALRFDLHVTEPTGHEVHAIALTVDIDIDPARRSYDEETRERLVDLFGAPERWSGTAHPIRWTSVAAMVPPFTGATAFPVEVPCTYDLELAAAKYFYALPDGEVPLAMHFTGTVLFAGEQDRLQVVRVPWSCIARYRMPVAAWRAALAACYPSGGWVRLEDDTLAVLAAHRAAHGHHSFDQTIRELLEAQR